MIINPMIHVAYADDHIVVRKGIIALMESLGGISVDIEADHGKDLISRLEKTSRLPDIIILDIHMPQMDGFQTAYALKERWPHIRSLVLTAFENEIYLIQMINIGVNGYLLKNCHPNNIKEALVSIYEYGFYYADATEERFFKQVSTGKISLPHFTDNEMEYLKYCPSDLSYIQIAAKMGTTVKAIEGYMTRLCEKLHVKGRIGLAMCAVQFGLVKIDVNTQKKFLCHKR